MKKMILDKLMVKKVLYGFISVLLITYMLLLPGSALDASKNGLLLWFNTLLPTLLPFMILSNLIIQLQIIPYITFFLTPTLGRVLRISNCGCYAVLTGFLCGYPMGAKTCADLVRSGEISREEGQYLLSFCNNVSPTFLMTFVILQSLQNRTFMFPTLLISFGAPITVSVLLRSSKHKSYYASADLHAANVNPPTRVSFELIDRCIMDGFENITKLGGYIILFSIAASLLNLLPIPNILIKFLMLGLIEISNGVSLISAASLPLSLQFPLLMGIIAFGGFSSMAQTESMLHGSGLSLRKYLAAKILTMLIAILYGILYINFIY